MTKLDTFLLMFSRFTLFLFRRNPRRLSWEECYFLS